MSEARKRFQDRLQILGVCLDSADARDKALAFVSERKQDWPQAFDGHAFDGAAPKAYNVTGIPSLFLIDAEGRIAAKNLRGDGIAKAVEALLAK